MFVKNYWPGIFKNNLFWKEPWSMGSQSVSSVVAINVHARTSILVYWTHSLWQTWWVLTRNATVVPLVCYINDTNRHTGAKCINTSDLSLYILFVSTKHFNLHTRFHRIIMASRPTHKSHFSCVICDFPNIWIPIQLYVYKPQKNWLRFNQVDYVFIW